MDMALDWDLGDLYSVLGSASDLLCDLVQVTFLYPSFSLSPFVLSLRL